VIWAIVFAVAVLLAAYYAFRLAGDLLILAGMALAGIVRIAAAPFRKRRPH
jgi:hypothetical protein